MSLLQGPQTTLDSSMVFIKEVTITEKELGRGSYGSVYAAFYHGEPCVAKVLYPILKIRGKVSRDIAIEECNILNKLKHPSIVQFYGVCESQFEVPILIMEKLWKNLDALLEEKQNQMSLLTKTHILHNVACGLQYMHNQKTPVIHRDINATNVMLTEHLQAKIIDVGQARILGVAEKQRLSPAPGKHAYMAPETLKNEPTYDTKADVFSLGCTIVYLVTEIFPEPTEQFVRDKNKSNVFVKISELDRRKKFIDLMDCSDFLSDMVHQCLKELPTDRPTASCIYAELEKYIQQLQSASPALAEQHKQDKLSLLYMLQTQEKEHTVKVIYYRSYSVRVS